MKLSKARSAREARRGTTLLDVLAAIAVTAILLFLVIPWLAGPKVRINHINCVNNLKNIGLGFRTFGVDYGGSYPWQIPVTNGGILLPPSGSEPSASNNVFAIFACISNELSTPRIVRCPQDNRKPMKTNSWWYGMSLGTNSANLPSYFIGIDASEELPQSLLCGDRNIIVRSAGLDYKTSGHYNRITTIDSANTAMTNRNNIGWSIDIHTNAGNILLGDGSVQQSSSERVREQLRDSRQSVGTNLSLFFPAL